MLAASYDDFMMEDFRAKKEEIFRLRQEGNLEEAKRLQNELYDKVSFFIFCLFFYVECCIVYLNDCLSDAKE